MKLLVRRDQKKGLMGGMTFLLYVKADLSEEEKANISKYELSQTALYVSEKISITAGDLWVGKKIECKSIVEMLEIEAETKEACKVFNAVLLAAKNFGGEEIVEIA